jgi:hypothetical protein
VVGGGVLSGDREGSSMMTVLLAQFGGSIAALPPVVRYAIGFLVVAGIVAIAIKILKMIGYTVPAEAINILLIVAVIVFGILAILVLASFIW